MVEARRNVPINKTDVIAMLIFAHFFKQHTPALKGTVIFSREEMPREPLTLDLELFDFF